MGSVPAGAVQRVRRTPTQLAGPAGHVRLDQQRHRLLDRPARPQRRPGAPRRAGHRRPLLRAAVRRRLDEQLRLRRPPRHRHRRRDASCSSPPGWDGAAARRRDGDPAARPRWPRIVGRWAVDGDDDLPAVRALQDAADADAADRRGRRRACPSPTPACAEDLRVLRAAAGLDRRRSRRPRATSTTQQRFAPLGPARRRVAVRRPRRRARATRCAQGLAAGKRALEHALDARRQPRAATAGS